MTSRPMASGLAAVGGRAAEESQRGQRHLRRRHCVVREVREGGLRLHVFEWTDLPAAGGGRDRITR